MYDTEGSLAYKTAYILNGADLLSNANNVAKRTAKADTEITVDTDDIDNAVLYVFAASAQTGESNIVFNGNVYENVWNGTSSTTDLFTADVTGLINDTNSISFVATGSTILELPQIIVTSNTKTKTALITPTRVISVANGISGYDYQFILKDENGNALDHGFANQLSTAFSDASKNMTEESQLGVYQHYNPTECELYSLKPDGHYGMRSQFEPGKKPIIGVRLEGNASGIKVCDYADEIISSFAHEKGHVDLYWELGGDVSKYKAISKDVREQIAVKAEMSNPSWDGTREVYKKDARRYGEKYGLKFNEKGELIQ
jgi:hypothetical protein